jgi:quinol monooxygenase YgiN
MGLLEVIAHAKVRPGRLEGFKAQAAEIVRVTRERDKHTLRCDWFINEDGTQCEVHELFPDERGLIEHSSHIMEARAVLFRDHAFDHQATLYGEVSREFIDMLNARMGAPTVFSFLQGLDQPATSTHPKSVFQPSQAEPISRLGVTAHLKIRPGELAGFKAQAHEIMRLTREKDTQTIRYDWFIRQDGTGCEVHEAYMSQEGLVEHNTHVLEARALLFANYAYDHRMTVYGEISQHLRDLFNQHAGGASVYSFLHGLELAPAV